MRDFRGLSVWEKAHRLTLGIDRETRTFPPEERYGVTAQIRRAVGSIPTNIAEGCGRESDREVARFMMIAAGSASETQYLLFLARGLGYLEKHMYPELNDRVTEIRRMLNGFVQFLRLNRWNQRAKT